MVLKLSNAPSHRARALAKRAQTAQAHLAQYMVWCDDLADKSVGNELLHRVVVIKETLHFAQAKLSQVVKNEAVTVQACDEFEAAFKDALKQASELQGIDGSRVGG